MDVFTLHIIPEARHTVFIPRDIPFSFILLPSYSRMFLLKGRKTKPSHACVCVRHVLHGGSPRFVPRVDALEAAASAAKGQRLFCEAAEEPSARGLGSHPGICGGTCHIQLMSLDPGELFVTPASTCRQRGFRLHWYPKSQVLAPSLSPWVLLPFADPGILTICARHPWLLRRVAVSPQQSSSSARLLQAQ